jgi:hypothetical protein
MPIRIRRRDKGVILMQDIDISEIMVIGRRDVMASYTDRKPNPRTLCGSI